METFLNNKEKPDVDEMAKFLKTLSKEEQQAIKHVLQGMELQKKLELGKRLN